MILGRDNVPSSVRKEPDTMSLLSQAAAPSDQSARELQSLRGSWGWLLVLGIALIVLGLLAFGSEFTALAVTLTFAVLLLIGGGAEIAAALFARRWSGFFVHMLFGILYMILGLLMIEHPGFAADALALMLAAAFMAGGLLRIVVALTHRFSNWGWVLFNGLITFVLGVMIWRRWPNDSEWIIGLFVGIELVVTGWSWVVLALAARSASRHSV
jgi:uncharacterized membrane protein HdeD (DUF308 family)